MKAERVVVDTNVLISALLQPNGGAAAVLEAIRLAGALMMLSDETFAELASRLMRPKFDRYLVPAMRQQFVADIAAVGEWVAIAGAIRACRDPDDDKFLETAVNGSADCIISGDTDLLALDPFRGIRILAPRSFLSLVEEGKPR